MIQNSADEISDSETRIGGNRMPAIFRQVEAVMTTGSFYDIDEISFNLFQIKEEKAKLLWRQKYSDNVESLFMLEDHPLLYGQVSVVGLDHPQYFARFRELFDCDWDLVDCALLTFGNYAQAERNGWRYQMGSGLMDIAWRNLFHNSANSGYERTRRILQKILSTTTHFTDEILSERIENYLTECERRRKYDWRYYYIKYESFRLGRYGKYSWMDFENKPYEVLAMWTEHAWSSNARQPFLYEIDSERIDRDDYGCSLLYSDKYVLCENSAFVVYDLETGDELERVKIKQDQEGIDIEDRILKGRRQLRRLI